MLAGVFFPKTVITSRYHFSQVGRVVSACPPFFLCFLCFLCFEVIMKIHGTIPHVPSPAPPEHSTGSQGYKKGGPGLPRPPVQFYSVSSKIHSFSQKERPRRNLQIYNFWNQPNFPRRKFSRRISPKPKAPILHHPPEMPRKGSCRSIRYPSAQHLSPLPPSRCSLNAEENA